MKRRKIRGKHQNYIITDNPPDVILTSDWHLREDTPISRTDDFWKAQWKKVDWVASLQKKYNCPVLHAGDLFHHWKPSPYLISMTAKHLPNQFRTIYGQHDLPQHNLELKHKSGIHALNSTLNIEKFQVLKEASWGQEPTNGSYSFWFENGSTKEILVWHKHIYKTIEPWPGCESPRAIELLKKYPQFDLILTGDNHIPFVQKYKGRLLVNPGSLMRQNAEQIEYKPRVYFWFADTNEVVKKYIPIQKNVISREHIEIEQKREKRIEAFISILNNKGLDYLDFMENLNLFFKKNKVRKEVKEIILNAIGK
jgi:DNA repair exonuclease SbcCD nuclease subunit